MSYGETTYGGASYGSRGTVPPPLPEPPKETPAYLTINVGVQIAPPMDTPGVPLVNVGVQNPDPQSGDGYPILNVGLQNPPMVTVTHRPKGWGVLTTVDEDHLVTIDMANAAGYLIENVT
jgi:hypothetical protein